MFLISAEPSFMSTIAKLLADALVESVKYASVDSPSPQSTSCASKMITNLHTYE